MSSEAGAGTVRRTRARALTGLLLLLAMGSGVWLFGYWEPRLLPVRMIEVQGELHNHSSELLQKSLGERLSGGILTADLRDLQKAAQALPWVGRASLRRVWPDRLQVRVEEHKPVARWGHDGLVTAEGLIFHPRTGTVPAGLPVLVGEDQRAPELVARYLKWRDDLMLAGQLIDAVEVDPRGSWRVDLISGTRLELGTGPVEQRLARFIAASPQLEAAGPAEVLDMRYRNGFAVRWAHRPALEARAEASANAQAPAASGSKAAARKTGSSKPSSSTKSGKTAKSAKGVGAKGTVARRSAKGSTTTNGAAASKAPRTAAAKSTAARPGASTKSSAQAKPTATRGSTRAAPVEERSMNARKSTDRKLQAQTDRKTADRNL